MSVSSISMSSPRKNEMPSASTKHGKNHPFKIGLNLDLNFPRQQALTPRDEIVYDDSVPTERIDYLRKIKDAEHKKSVANANFHSILQRQLSKIFPDKKDPKTNAAGEKMMDKITTDSFGNPLAIKKVKQQILERPLNGPTASMDFQIKS